MKAYVSTRKARLHGRGFGWQGYVVLEGSATGDFAHCTSVRSEPGQARSDAEAWARHGGFELVDRSEVS